MKTEAKLDAINLNEIEEGFSEIAGCTVRKATGKLTETQYSVYNGLPRDAGFSTRELNYERIETSRQFRKILGHTIVAQAGINEGTRVDLHWIQKMHYEPNAKSLGINLDKCTVGDIIKMMDNPTAPQFSKPKFFKISFYVKSGNLPTECTL